MVVLTGRGSRWARTRARILERPDLGVIRLIDVANRRRALAVALAVLALAGGLTAVLVSGGGDGDHATTGQAGPAGASTATGTPTTAGPTDPVAPGGGAEAPIIVPGRPGEAATVTDGDAVGPRPAPAYNSMDAWFVRMMIPHHTQALQMAALAADRAADPAVRALADRVRASQVPEIQLLRGWLADRHLGADDPDARHEHASMPGMQSPAAMRRLTDARGAEFDRLFVEMMTAHHRGAITMATDLLRVGVDTTVHQFANSVAVEQGVEIDRMSELLDR